MYYNYKFNQNSILNFVIKERGAGKAYAILKKTTKDIPIKHDPATNEILEGTPHVL